MMIVIGQPHSLEGSTMRPHQIIVIAVALVAGFGVKQLFFSAPPAEANAPFESVRIDVSQMQQNIKNLPEQKMNDMTFVFSEGD
jgi:hypothetical protein